MDKVTEIGYIVFNILRRKFSSINIINFRFNKFDRLLSYYI
ncbi:MAG: hypothetical protein BAJATHORv1_30102 [Candidatus Thorarchaeota archaeon]|nr:MAG: hypothetical protein BAJATHORv1_30102 [Candidatus Thorarchaeota archaeon]